MSVLSFIQLNMSFSSKNPKFLEICASQILRGVLALEENLKTFFKFPEEIKRLIYTTNAVESRKVTKTKSVFPTDDALLKMLFLASREISKKWTLSGVMVVYTVQGTVSEATVTNYIIALPGSKTEV